MAVAYAAPFLLHVEYVEQRGIAPNRVRHRHEVLGSQDFANLHGHLDFARRHLIDVDRMVLLQQVLNTFQRPPISIEELEQVVAALATAQSVAMRGGYIAGVGRSAITDDLTSALRAT